MILLMGQFLKQPVKKLGTNDELASPAAAFPSNYDNFNNLPVYNGIYVAGWLKAN